MSYSRLCRLAAGVAALAVGACGGAAEDTGTVGTTSDRSRIDGDANWAHAAPARFTDLPEGWRQFTAGPARLTRHGGDTFTFATSWPYEESAHGPAGDMPPNGILVEVRLRRRDPRRSASHASCPGPPPWPRYGRLAADRVVMPARPRFELEGSDGTPQYRVDRRVRDEYNLAVSVNIDRPRPTARQRGQAQQVLDGLALPRWPREC